MDEEEHVLKVEAEEAVKEIAYAVQEVSLSTSLPSNDEIVYLNVKTKEGHAFCVELTAQGFRVGIVQVLEQFSFQLLVGYCYEKRPVS